MKTRIYLERLYQPTKMNATANFLWSYMIMFSGTVLCLSFKSNGGTYGDNFQCNMNALLVCQIESRPINIVITINKTTAAYCLNAKCFENKAILGEYTVSNDTSLGILRLHIQKVSVADARNIFTCDGDSTSQTVQLVVKEFPTYHSAAMTVIEKKSEVQINVTSGCVLLERHVRVEWTKLKAVPNAVPEVLPASKFLQTDMMDNTVCKSCNNCGAYGLTSTLTFMNEIDGTTEEFYIQCSIVVTDDHAPGNVILVTNNTFNFRGIALLKIFPCGIPYVGVVLIIKFYWKEYEKYIVDQYKKHQSDKNDDRTYKSSTELSSGSKHSSAFNCCSNPQYDTFELNGKSTIIITTGGNLKSSDNSKTAEDDGEIAAQSQYDSVTHTDIELEHHQEHPDDQLF